MFREYAHQKDICVLSWYPEEIEIMSCSTDPTTTYRFVHVNRLFEGKFLVWSGYCV